MTASSVTGTGPGDSGKRVAYLSIDLPKLITTKTTSNPQDLITGVDGTGGGTPVTLQCDPPGGNPRGFQAIDLQCCREFDTQVASGDYSFIAAGCQNTASGKASHAEGFHTIASGYYSHSEGQHTEATTYACHAEGFNTEASGTVSHAEGSFTIASGTYSHAEGSFTTANSLTSHAEGAGTIASGTSSHAEGHHTTSSGSFSHTEGTGTITFGQASHAEGTNTVASGYFSHAEGSFTYAYGNSSHSEGYYTYANGNNSHAEGQNNTADGLASHVEGADNTASGDYSHSEGLQTEATARASHAGGVRSLASLQGQFSTASGSWSSGPGGGAGMAQTTVATLIGTTDLATPTVELTLDGLTPAVGNRFTIDTGKSYLFTIEIIARGTIFPLGTGQVASYVRYCVLDNDAPTVTLVGTVETIGTDKGTNAGIPPVGWTVTITADNVNKSITITVTNTAVNVGDVARWVARIQSTEVSYLAV